MFLSRLSLLCFFIFLIALTFDSFSLILISSTIIGPNLSFTLDWASLFFWVLLYFITTLCWSNGLSYLNKAFSTYYLSSFFFFFLSITLLIFSRDAFSLFIAWDGLGLSSALLVSVYHSTSARTGCATTLCYNRVGDVLIIARIIRYTNRLLTVSIAKISATPSLFMFLLVLGLIRKRAQFPFCSWLPSAIAAPTTVTALVHSSTVVTAGVWCLVRLGASSWLGCSCFALLLSTYTFFGRRLRAYLTFDAKRVVAITTLANLSLIILFLFRGNSCMAILHLFGHALVKRLTFIGLASSIKERQYRQDLRSLSLSSCKLLLIPLVLQVAHTRSCYYLVKHKARSSIFIGYPFFLFFFTLSFFLFAACLGRLVWLSICFACFPALVAFSSSFAFLFLSLFLPLLLLALLLLVFSSVSRHSLICLPIITDGSLFFFFFFSITRRKKKNPKTIIRRSRHPLFLLLPSASLSY